MIHMQLLRRQVMEIISDLFVVKIRNQITTAHLHAILFIFSFSLSYLFTLIIKWFEQALVTALLLRVILSKSVNGWSL